MMYLYDPSLDMPRMTKTRQRVKVYLTTLDKKKRKAKRKRRKARKRARRMALQLDKMFTHKDDKCISEDDCDFDFDNSGIPLCSTSEDDSDGPQGNL